MSATKLGLYQLLDLAIDREFLDSVDGQMDWHLDGDVLTLTFLWSPTPMSAQAMEAYGVPAYAETTYRFRLLPDDQSGD